MSKKKQLTNQQEFEIMKLVLDKFLWVGVAIMVLGLYTLVSGDEMLIQGFFYMIGGAILLLLFMVLIVKEYEVLK
ncbi:MAG: hypothetical protein ACOCZ6_03160 [Nanoarchaeota archaeon]